MKKNNLSLATYFVFIGLLLSVVPAFAEFSEPLYPHYPQRFDKQGQVDAMSAERVVVNDISYRFAPAHRFYGPMGSVVASSISHRSKVGVLLNPDGEVESLWLIEKSSQERETVKSPPAKSTEKTDRGGIYFKDGVWRND